MVQTFHLTVNYFPYLQVVLSGRAAIDTIVVEWRSKLI